MLIGFFFFFWEKKSGNAKLLIVFFFFFFEKPDPEAWENYSKETKLILRFLSFPKKKALNDVGPSCQ